MNRQRTNLHAFTLAETAVSLAIVSVLVVGMMSAIVVASRAIPDPAHPSHAFAIAQPSLDRFLDDLQGATHIVARSPWSVSFAVPDRDADGYPEVIRYEWSGKVDDPWLRRENGGAFFPVLEHIGDFRLDFQTASTSDSFAGAVTESAETILASETGSGAATIFRLNEASWLGQLISPTLSPDAVAWKPSRILVNVARTHRASGSLHAVLETADDAGLPSGTLIEEADIAESVLPRYAGWFELPVSNQVQLNPTQSVCAMFETSDTRTVAKFSAATGSSTGLLTNSTQSDLWSLNTGDGLWYYLYGTTLQASIDEVLTREHFTIVRAGVQTSTAMESRVETSVLLLNTPDVLTKVWETHFDADPTRLDLNDDGVGDWRHSDGRAFNMNKLSDGRFWADGSLDTNPGYNFDSPSTVDVRYRDTTNDNASGGVKLRVDRDGNTYAMIQAEINNIGNGQQLTVTTYDAMLRLVTPVEVMLGHGWIDLEITVLPDQDSFRVRVDDADLGTFTYGRITATSAAVIRLYENAEITGIQFDWVRVRVGGTTE